MDNSLVSFLNIFRQRSWPDTLNVSNPSSTYTTNEQQRNRQAQNLFKLPCSECGPADKLDFAAGFAKEIMIGVLHEALRNRFS